jgi:hypothetical protein
MTKIHIPELVYEVVIQRSNNETISEFFYLPNILLSRKKAIEHFLSLSNCPFKPDEEFIQLFMLHVLTGERLRLIDSTIIGKPINNLKVLEREAFIYEKQNIIAHIAIFDPSKPINVTVFFPWSRNLVKLKSPKIYFLLSQYSAVFLGSKLVQRIRW